MASAAPAVATAREVHRQLLVATLSVQWHSRYCQRIITKSSFESRCGPGGDDHLAPGNDGAKVRATNKSNTSCRHQPTSPYRDLANICMADTKADCSGFGGSSPLLLIRLVRRPANITTSAIGATITMLIHLISRHNHHHHRRHHDKHHP